MAKIELLNIDCMSYMAGLPDKAFDLAIVDPPYGIGMDGSKMPHRTGNVIQKNGERLSVARNDYRAGKWDSNSPDGFYFSELFRVSENQIIWGANHFISKLPIDSSCWIVWDKVNVGTNQSDCELAWSSFDTAVRKFDFMWSGMCQGLPGNGRRMQGNKKLNEKRIHPTQKPIPLYKWLLTHYAVPGESILDTHGGSRSLAIACHHLGFDHVSCEIDTDYHNDSVKRFKEQTAQTKLAL